VNGGGGGRIGDLELDLLVGEGATGRVYAARTPSRDRVAVKVLRSEYGDDAVLRRRFLREARLAREIRSRHVVPILDVGEADGVTYLVMPFYERGSLATRLRSDGPLALDTVVDLAAQVARGLDALHAHGIVHRDVKPSNILLARDGSVVLGDFGLARSEHSTHLTEAGELIGTPHYLAPELIEGGGALPAADIYALGCVVYEALTGTPPFTGSGVAEIAFAHLVEPPPDPRQLRPELPADAAVALQSALAKDPSTRPTTATALARMLHVARRAAPA
jgi:serine/threonine-protein kinase